MVIRYLIQKEFLQIRRNAFLPKIFVVLPIVMLLIVPYAANQEIRNLKFCVVDNDRSTMSRRLVEQVDASSYFALTSVEGGYGSALAQVEQGTADVILEIPHGFSTDVVRTGEASVNVHANAVNGVKGALGQAYMLNIVSDFASSQRAEHGVGVGRGASSGIDVRPRYLFNPSLDYKVFMVPGIIAMLLTLLIGYLPALNIVGEFSTPIAVALRLFGNMASGIVVTSLLYQALTWLSDLVFGGLTSFPIFAVGIPAVLSIYFDLFTGCMQAFIISMLCMVFVEMAMD